MSAYFFRVFFGQQQQHHHESREKPHETKSRANSKTEPLRTFPALNDFIKYKSPDLPLSVQPISHHDERMGSLSTNKFERRLAARRRTVNARNKNLKRRSRMCTQTTFCLTAVQMTNQLSWLCRTTRAKYNKHYLSLSKTNQTISANKIHIGTVRDLKQTRSLTLNGTN